MQDVSVLYNIHYALSVLDMAVGKASGCSPTSRSQHSNPPIEKSKKENMEAESKPRREVQ